MYFIHVNIYFTCTFDTYVHFTSDTLRLLLKSNINMGDFHTITLLLLKNNFECCLHHWNCLEQENCFDIKIWEKLFPQTTTRWRNRPDCRCRVCVCLCVGGNLLALSWHFLLLTFWPKAVIHRARSFLKAHITADKQIINVINMKTMESFTNVTAPKTQQWCWCCSPPKPWLK